MLIGIYSEAVNHFIETLAYFISLGGRHKVLLITKIESGKLLSEHPWCLGRIKQAKNIELVSPDKTPQKVDWLYFHMPRNHFLWNNNLNAWVSKAKKIGCLREARYGKDWKREMRELAYSFPYYLLAKSIVLQGSLQDRNPYRFIKNKYFYSPSAHPQFLVNAEWKKKLFQPVDKIDNARIFKFAFIGNKNPLERIAILGNVKEKFKKMNNTTLVDTLSNINSNKTNVLWIEYDNEGPKRGLDPKTYAETLGRVDFSICPPGWGQNWTHRVVESLSRGAIPILEDEKIYNIDLTDMKNCIVVKDSNWAEAIDIACGFSVDEIRKIRSNIIELRDKYLLPEVAALRLRTAMQLE